MKKGYVFVVLFSLFISVGYSLRYRLYIKRDFQEVTITHLLVQMAVNFIVFLIPGLLLVRWYYKLKNR